MNPVHPAAASSSSSSSPSSGLGPVRGALFLIAASALCYGATWVVREQGELVLYVTWGVALTAAGFVSGWAWPRSAIWGGLLITWSQSAFVYWQLDASGELAEPRSSTGGMVAWGIITFLLIAFSPCPALASWWGRCVRCPPDRSARASAR